MRMGENIDEALEDPEWRCPSCRDIWNCSGANCLRAKRNLFPTQQLTHEAHTFGWQSVARRCKLDPGLKAPGFKSST